MSGCEKGYRDTGGRIKGSRVTVGVCYWSEKGFLMMMCRDPKGVKVTKGQVTKTSEVWFGWREHLSCIKTAHFF